MTRPTPYNVRDVPTAFMDARTAGGVTDAGRQLPRQVQKGAHVGHYLRAAHAAGVERVYLVGPRPTKGWLFAPTPDWTPGAHYVDPHALDVARFTHATTGARVELRQAAEWFGWGEYSPALAQKAWTGLAWVHRRAFGAPLLASPSATGTDAWARTVPKDRDVPQLETEVQELLRATSCQHHIELGRDVPAQLPGFVYMDGRFMFSALTKELGVGPVTRDDVDTADSYERARYRVTARVPDDWPFLGVLPLNVGPGEWEWPAEPGRAFTTWADGAETRLARAWGWEIEVHERLLFSRGRPLDTWTDKLVRARAAVDGWGDEHADVRRLVKGALRAVLVQGIGAFHSTGRPATRVSFAPMQDGAPGGGSWHGPAYVWREPRTLTGRAAAFQHPEWSAQVWSRGHTRILDFRGTGLLHVPPHWVVGVRGDAVYLTFDPEWPDDGAVGRITKKGELPGPLPAPRDLDGLNKLRARAEKAGT